jgi:copper chaperone
METAIIDVEGMSCQGCVASVNRVLSAIPGVHAVSVTLKPGTASVTYDPARTNLAALKGAIEDAGYAVDAA